MPRLFGCSCEISVGVGQSRIEVQGGVEKRRMQPELAVDREIRRQPNSRQDLAATPLQHLDGAKRRAIFQSRGAQALIVALDRDRAGASLPDAIKLEWRGSAPHGPLLA